MSALDTPSTEAADTVRETFKRYRKMLKLSQAQLAGALGISKKAVQSYEQGWRLIPLRTLRELLNLVLINRGVGRSAVKRCWEIMKCPAHVMQTCPAVSVTKGHFCWMVGRTNCAKLLGESSETLRCINCPVTQQLGA